MSRIKYVESNVPENMNLRVQYLHQGHVAGMPTNMKRITVATLLDLEGRMVAKACSVCHENDNDNRKIGRAIAVGRALKEYYTNAV